MGGDWKALRRVCNYGNGGCLCRRVHACRPGPAALDGFCCHGCLLRVCASVLLTAENVSKRRAALVSHTDHAPTAALTCRPHSYRKTSAEFYEARARGHMRSLRSSQISTHLGGLDSPQPGPAPPGQRRDKPAVATPASSSRAPPTEQQDRRSLLECWSADEVTV